LYGLGNVGASNFHFYSAFRKATAFRDGKLARPSLALNCVGGDNATELTKCLADGGIMVTYGGMSMKPVTVPTSALIFRDVQVRGFWYSRWVRQNEHSPQRAAMYEELAAMAASGELRPPRHKVVALRDYKQVLGEAAKGFKQAKLIFKME
jgi:trans-2-enoyl-CoA reductase